MFIRKKGEIHYLVENHRVNGKVRQVTVACLGREGTIEDRIYELTCRLEWKPPEWDDKKKRYQRWGEMWRFYNCMERRLGLSHDAFWMVHQEKYPRYMDAYGAYTRYRDEHIDIYLKQEHEKKCTSSTGIVPTAKRNSPSCGP